MKPSGPEGQKTPDDGLSYNDGVLNWFRSQTGFALISILGIGSAGCGMIDELNAYDAEQQAKAEEAMALGREKYKEIKAQIASCDFDAETAWEDLWEEVRLCLHRSIPAFAARACDPDETQRMMDEMEGECPGVGPMDRTVRETACNSDPVLVKEVVTAAINAQCTASMTPEVQEIYIEIDAPEPEKKLIPYPVPMSY